MIFLREDAELAAERQADRSEAGQDLKWRHHAHGPASSIGPKAAA